MDIKLFFKYAGLNRNNIQENSVANSAEKTDFRKSINFSSEESKESSLKGRAYPVASTGYANFFFADDAEKQQKLIADLELVFSQILPKIRIPFFSKDNSLEFHGFFSEVEKIVHKHDPNAKVYLGGGSIRSILSFIYKELLEAKKQGLDPLEVLEDLGKGFRKFSVEDEKGGVSPMHVLGIESDIDIYIQFSKNFQTNTAIGEVREFINRGLSRLAGDSLKALVFPSADVKSYEEQMQRASRNGGSALDWVVFPLTCQNAHFKVPPACPHVLQSLCQGKLPYYPVDRAEIPAITTLRAYRSLFELPFLELDQAEHSRFVKDLTNVVPALEHELVRDRTAQVFRKIVRNTRFPDRVNFEVQDRETLQQLDKKALREISLKVKSDKNLPAIPEFLPSMVNAKDLDEDLIQKFTDSKLFMPMNDFIQKHTDKGVLYHGTPHLRNLAPMIRGNLVVSNQNQGSAAYGRGFYSTKDLSTAQKYARGSSVISFFLQGDLIRIVDLKAIPSPLLEELKRKAAQKKMDVNEYLSTYLQVDIVINEHVLLQNSRVFSLNKTQEQFLLDAFSADFMKAIEYFKNFKEDSCKILKWRDAEVFKRMFKCLDSYPIVLGLIKDRKLAEDFHKENKPIIEKALNEVLKIVESEEYKNSDKRVFGVYESFLSEFSYYDFFEVFLVTDDKRLMLAILPSCYRIDFPKYIKSASDRLKDDEEFVLAVLEKNKDALKYASDRLKDSKEFVLAALEKNKDALKYTSDRLKDSKEVVLVAVENKGGTLEYASDRLKDDKEVVLAAVEKDGHALWHASDRLKDDKEVVLAAVEKDGHALWHASDRLKGDKEVVLVAVKNKGGTLEYASDRLKDDKDVVLAAVKNYPDALKHASDRLKDDRDFILAAIKGNPDASNPASSRFKNDYYFVKEVLKIEKINTSDFFEKQGITRRVRILLLLDSLLSAFLSPFKYFFRNERNVQPA